MHRFTASLVALLLFTSSLAAAVGQVEICIGNGHVALAADDHGVASAGCCGHAHSCTDIVVEGISHTAPIACDSADVQAPAAIATVDLPRLQLHPPRASLNFRPDHPPPIGLIIAQHTVRRL